MKRPLAIGCAAALVAALAAGYWARSRLAGHDALEGVDVAGARDSGAGAAPIGGAPAGAEAPLPDLEALRRITDRGRLEALAARLEEALLAPDAAAGDLHVLLSVARRALGDLDAARAHAERGVALLPRNSRARYVQAEALRAGLLEVGRQKDWTAVLGSLGEIGEYKAALAAAIELDPANLAARDEELGVLLFAPWPVGAKAAGLARLAELEALDPARGALWRAQLLALDEAYADALAAVDAVAVNALDAVTRDRRTMSRGDLLQRLERLQEAAAVYAPLAARRPRDPAAWRAAYQLLRVREKGRLELEAAVALAREMLAARPAGDLVPDPASVAYRLGQCLEHLGRPDEARAAFEQSLELDPRQDRAREALERLEPPR